MPVITVHGTPAPQGSKRFVGVNKQGRGILVESSKKVKPWREAVKQAALATEGLPVVGPVHLEIVFTVPKPASAPKRTQTYPMRKPDIDKLTRSTLDGLVDAGAIEDDARVVEMLVCKCFPGEEGNEMKHPGAVITIRRYPLDGGSR